MRGVRHVEAVAVHAPQERHLQRAPVAGLPAQLRVHVAHTCAEFVQAAQRAGKHLPNGPVFPGQGRNPERGHVREFLPDGAFRADARQEIVQRDAEPLRLGGRLGDHPQVRRREVALGAVEAALAQFRALHHLRRHDRRQPQDVRVSIDRHPVQREQVVASPAAAHVHRRRAVRTRCHTRQALRPADRIPLAQRRGHRPDPLQARLQTPQALLDPAHVRLHRRLQRVSPGRGGLGKRSTANKQE